jgi:hypothetical protein
MKRGQNIRLTYATERKSGVTFQIRRMQAIEIQGDGLHPKLT